MIAPVDAPSTLMLLDFGSFRVREDGRVIPIPGYLIRSREGRIVLVDTGFPRSYLSDPGAAAGDDGLDSFGTLVRIGPDNTPRGQLALAGLRPSDVTDLVLTHSDVDHVGRVGEFASVPIHVGRAERALARPRYFGEAQPLAWPEAEYSLVDGDKEIFPGLVALSTPGHSPGHLSLLLRLGESGTVVLAGDAISRASELETQENGGAWSAELALRSAERLVDLAARESALLVLGHDPEQWPTLRHAPAAYC